MNFKSRTEHERTLAHRERWQSVVIVIALWLAATGVCLWSLQSGEIRMGYSNGAALMLARAHSPVLYWLIWSLWAFLAGALGFFSINAWRQGREQQYSRQQR